MSQTYSFYLVDGNQVIFRENMLEFLMGQACLLWDEFESFDESLADVKLAQVFEGTCQSVVGLVFD